MKYSINSQLKFLSLLLLFTVHMRAQNLQKVYLSSYGDIGKEDTTIVFQRALDNISNKCLILPSGNINIKDVTIFNKNNFRIEGNTTILVCGKFTIKNCTKFECYNFSMYGTRNKLAYFDIVGNCNSFTIDKCIFDSEENGKGENMFYGIHIQSEFTDNAKINNSPRNFVISNNQISKTRYDGILIHANCSNFKVCNNTVRNSSCIGIEVEGRYGGPNDTKVHPCYNGEIYNNKIYNCGDWNILLMWLFKFKVYSNYAEKSRGCFQSIGSRDGEIYNNNLSSINFGFQIGQEIYSVSTGINSDIKIYDNIIKARAYSLYRGVIDIRQSKGIHFIRNSIWSIFNYHSSTLNINSSQDIIIKNNTFYFIDKPTLMSIDLHNIIDQSTKKELPSYNNKNITISGNTFPKTEGGINTSRLNLTKSKIIIKNNTIN